MTADALDPRILRIGVEINGRLKTYEGLAATASGTKFANPLEDECEVRITNMDADTRAYLLTEASPFNGNNTPKRLVVEAGRVSTGTTRVYVGDITQVSVSQPPDITITLKAKTGQAQKGKIVAAQAPALASLSSLSQQTADSLGATLNFQADDKQIANYSHSGSALSQVGKLSDAGDVDVYLDGNTLVVKGANVPLTGRLRNLDMSSGMIGIPELTEQGVKVKMLFDSQTTLGGALRISSRLNPAAAGDYCIYKLSFDLANRDTPWYWTAEAKSL
jgi:hypothetical protein